MLNRIGRLANRVFNLHSIFYQLILFTLITSILPLCVSIFLINRKANALIEEDLIASYKQMQAQYIANIEYKFSLYDSSIVKIASNSAILDALTGNDYEEYPNPYTRGNIISREIGNFLSLKSQSELTNCMVYSLNNDVSVYGVKTTMADIAANESWYGYYRQMGAHDYFIDTSGAAMSLIKSIDYINTTSMRTESVGFVKMDLKTREFFAPTTESATGSFYYDVIVLDYNNDIIYSTNGQKGYDAELYGELTAADKEQNGITYYGDYICTYEEMISYPVQVMFFFHVGELGTKQMNFMTELLPILALVVLFIVITSFIFSRSFNRRVSVLVGKMQKAETGDMEITEYLGGNDEIAKLDNHFNLMISKLNDLIQKNYIQQMENREAQLRNLKLQINPHFLYNTLETVGSIAAVNGLMLAANITEKLGEIFRYSLGSNNGEHVTVEQELLHTQNYIFIQKVRYGDKFEVYYNIDRETRGSQMLRFILQPIVENTINHGLIKARRPGRLDISIYPAGERLIIKIADNGVGMDAELVRNLTASINEPGLKDEQGRGGIGLRNVNQRIKLICGAEYGITIESEPGGGSCFTITLPFR